MSCSTGKVEHSTVQSAQAHADSILKKDGHLPNVYVCKECGLFHVGGGRKSDRPSYRPVPTITTSKLAFVPKKIDDGKQLGLDAVILEKLRKTFITDVDIAKELCCDLGMVERLRLRNKIPSSFQRRRNAVLSLLVAQPDRSRLEIAKVAGVSDFVVKQVVKELGLAGSAKHRSGRRGIKHPNFGKHLSPELRTKISERTKEAENTTKWRTAASARCKEKNNLSASCLAGEYWRGRRHSEATKQKMRKARLSKKSPRLREQAVSG